MGGGSVRPLPAFLRLLIYGKLPVRMRIWTGGPASVKTAYMQTFANIFTGRHHHPTGWKIAGSFTAIVVAGAGILAATSQHTGAPLAVTLGVMASLLFVYLAFAMTSLTRDLQWWLREDSKRLLFVLFAFVGTYLVYARATDALTADALIRLLLFIGIPSGLIYAAGRATYVTWMDWLAVICIWIPFDAGWLKGIWTWPAGEGAYILNTIIAVNLAVVLFVCVRGFSEVRFRFSLPRQDLWLATKCLAGFMTVAIPLGLATDFIAWNPNVDAGRLLGVPLGIFFFVAVPEELLFRGLVQNFLLRHLTTFKAIAIASLFFGATHLNNGLEPDFRYFFLASVAGTFYGYCYLKSKSLLAPALVHSAVDTLWIWFFHVGTPN